MRCYRFSFLTLISIITHAKIFVQALDILSPVRLDQPENENLFDTPDQNIFENLDNDDLTLSAENLPDDFLLSGKSGGSCDNEFQSFRRYRVRSDDFCSNNNDQSVPGNGDNNPLIDFNQILAPPREGFKTQEQIVNFICPAATFQGVLDIPVCGHAGDFGVTEVTTPPSAQLFASILSNFGLYHVTYATLCKPILFGLFCLFDLYCITMQDR